jgi:hypothetical protein
MKKSHLLGVLHTCAISLLFTTVQSNAATVFTDDTFNDADWTASIIFQDGQTPSFTATQISSGGNPGAYRQVQHTYGGLVNNGSIVVGHLMDGATYDPSIDGAVSTIDFSFDLILFDGGDSRTVAYGGLILQNNSYYSGGYTTTSTVPTTNVWESNSIEDLFASDFSLVMGAGPAQPDFSSSGSIIQFGYFSGNSTFPATQTTTLSGIDNWSTTINPSIVPIPPALYLFGTGLLGLIGMAKRKKAA